MPFWGSSTKEDEQSTSKDFTSMDESSFAASSSNFAPSSSGGGASSAAADMQQFSLALRQQVLVQTVITNLADQAFGNCITGKPGDSLSGKEAACIHATVNKFMDTNDFIMGRLAKKSQRAQSGAF